MRRLKQNPCSVVPDSSPPTFPNQGVSAGNVLDRRRLLALL